MPPTLTASCTERASSVTPSYCQDISREQFIHRLTSHDSVFNFFIRRSGHLPKEDNMMNMDCFCEQGNGGLDGAMPTGRSTPSPAQSLFSDAIRIGWLSALLARFPKHCSLGTSPTLALIPTLNQRLECGASRRIANIIVDGVFLVRV